MVCLVNQPTSALFTDLPPENDFELFCELRQGNEAAFERLYNRYWLELYHAAYKRLPEKEKCQDIIQNIFTDLWLRREKLAIVNPGAYLHTAVRFQVLKHCARNVKRNPFSDAFLNELISPLESDHPVLEKEVKLLLENYIDTLSHKQQRIFVMHYYEGLSAANIAVALKVSAKTIQNQLSMVSQGLRFRLTHIFLTVMMLLSTLG